MKPDLKEIQKRLNKITPGKWETKERFKGSHIEIWSTVNLGLDENSMPPQPIYEVSIKPSFQMGEDGKVYLMISYESFRQFSSVNFKEMQRANSELIAHAPTDIKALLKYIEELEEIK